MLLKQSKCSAKFGIGHNISLQTFLQCIARAASWNLQ